MEKGCCCQGIRSCLLCEEKADGTPLNSIHPQTAASLIIFTQCHMCGKLFRRSATEDCNTCTVACSDSANRVLRPNFSPGQLPEGLTFDGVTVIRDFINEDEEKALIREINVHGWAESQSGRRKQVFSDVDMVSQCRAANLKTCQ